MRQELAVVVALSALCVAKAGTDDYDDDYDNSYSTRQFYYWGIYMAVFGGIYAFMLILDFFGVFGRFVQNVTNLAYGRCEDELRQQQKDVEVESYAKKTENNKRAREREARELPPLVVQYCMKDKSDYYREDDEFHPYFSQCMLAPRLYYGLQLSSISETHPNLFNFLTKMSRSGANSRVLDVVFYLVNNQPILSMGFASECNPYSKLDKRNTFFISNAWAFFFAVLFITLEINDFAAVTAINVLVVTPLLFMLTKLCYFIAACPCLQRQFQWEILNTIRDSRGYITSFISISMAFLCVFVYYIVGGFSAYADYYHMSGLDVLGKYMLSIFLTKFCVDVFLSVLLFVSFYFEIFVCGVRVFSIGRWMVEKLHYQLQSKTLDDSLDSSIFSEHSFLFFSVRTLNTNARDNIKAIAVSEGAAPTAVTEESNNDAAEPEVPANAV